MTSLIAFPTFLVCLSQHTQCFDDVVYQMHFILSWILDDMFENMNELSSGSTHICHSAVQVQALEGRWYPVPVLVIQYFRIRNSPNLSESSQSVVNRVLVQSQKNVDCLLGRRNSSH